MTNLRPATVSDAQRSPMTKRDCDLFEARINAHLTRALLIQTGIIGALVVTAFAVITALTH